MNQNSFRVLTEAFSRSVGSDTLRFEIWEGFFVGDRVVLFFRMVRKLPFPRMALRLILGSRCLRDELLLLSTTSRIIFVTVRKFERYYIALDVSNRIVMILRNQFVDG